MIEMIGQKTNSIRDNFLKQMKNDRSTIEIHKHSESNDSYRRYICKSNKDAARASWPFSGRACMYKTRRVFLSSDEVCDANVLGNLGNSDSYDIEASI